MKRTFGTITAQYGGDDAGAGGPFGAREAAMLLDQATVRARREFEPDPAWLLVVRGALALAVYGALWLSVRGQHPYQHPTAAVIWVGPTVGVINTVATLAVARRATAGIRGRSRLRPGETALMVLVWVAVFAGIGPMIAAGVPERVTYGLYPAAAPLIVAGLAWAGITAARGERRAAVTGVAVAAVGALALLAGPAGAWAVAGVGLCLLLLARAAEIAWRQRA